MRLIGLDIGTTGCKAAIFDALGNLLTSVSREYAVDIPRPNWAEQDAERVWRLAQDVLREAIAAAGSEDSVALGKRRRRSRHDQVGRAALAACPTSGRGADSSGKHRIFGRR